MHTTARIYHFLEIICALNRNWFKSQFIESFAFEDINSSKPKTFRNCRFPENSDFCIRTMCKNGENCDDLLAAPDPEVYFEFDMCVWDFKSEGQSQNFLITKTICGFIVPFIIISVSYILIAFRNCSFLTFHNLENDLKMSSDDSK